MMAVNTHSLAVNNLGVDVSRMQNNIGLLRYLSVYHTSSIFYRFIALYIVDKNATVYALYSSGIAFLIHCRLL